MTDDVRGNMKVYRVDHEIAHQIFTALRAKMHNDGSRKKIGVRALTHIEVRYGYKHTKI